MTVYTPLQNGQTIDADRLNEWIKNGNYGNALKPMAINGADVDNSLDLGSTSFRWRKLNAGGVVAGTPVGSFTVPERRTASFPLPAKDIGTSPYGVTTLFSIDISSLGNIYGAKYSLTFVGDDWSFQNKTGTIIQQAEESYSWTYRANVFENYYKTFHIKSVGPTVEVSLMAVWGGNITTYTNYYGTNIANWDGTTQSRGWLLIEYSPL